MQETEEIKSKGNEHVLFVFGFIFGRVEKGGEALWSDILVGDSVVIKTLSVSVIYPLLCLPSSPF